MGLVKRTCDRVRRNQMLCAMIDGEEWYSADDVMDLYGYKNSVSPESMFKGKFSRKEFVRALVNDRLMRFLNIAGIRKLVSGFRGWRSGLTISVFEEFYAKCAKIVLDDVSVPEHVNSVMKDDDLETVPFRSDMVVGFVETSGGVVRFVVIDGERNFFLSEVMSAAGYGTPYMAASRVSFGVRFINTGGGRRRIITLDGIHEWGMRTRKSGAYRIIEELDRLCGRIISGGRDIVVRRNGGACSAPAAGEAFQVFTSKEFGEVRVVMRDGEPWFVASDVARALGYAVPGKAVIDHCKKVNKFSLISKTESRQGPPVPPLNIIPESDVYRLVMRSKLPTAEKFQDWVCGEVLPSIRRHGRYSGKGGGAVLAPKGFEDEVAIMRMAESGEMSERSALAAVAGMCRARLISGRK